MKTSSSVATVTTLLEMSRRTAIPIGRADVTVPQFAGVGNVTPAKRDVAR